MRSGGPWNLRGLRPEARAAARDAARRSGMSVGEWLNTVIRPADENDEEAWWSAEVDREPDERFEQRPRHDYPERERHREAASPWHSREREPDETRRQRPRDDEPRYRDHATRRPAPPRRPRNAKTRNAKARNAKTRNAKSRGAKTRATINGVKASAMTSGRTATIAMLPGAVATASRMISSA